MPGILSLIPSKLPSFMLGALLYAAALGLFFAPILGGSDRLLAASPESPKAPAPKAPEGMILIPEGPFIMGSDDRWPDEGPMHTVYLEGFYIDKFEITNADYRKFAIQTRRPPPRHWQGTDYPPDLAKHPVTYVTWFDANDYCHWAGKRLPSDSEWEKAARGTDGRWFPWGNDFDPKKANTPQLKLGGTTPVGQFPQGDSPYGVSDLSGNVWEWTSSYYKAYPRNDRPTENYGNKYRVLKGGSWVHCSGYKCGISAPNFNRSFFHPGTNNQGFGFRCAKSLA